MIKRIEKVRNVIKKQNLDALFVTDQYNVTYLTNFAGLSPNEREGFLLITKKHAFLLTFPTYFGLYKEGGAGFATLNITHAKRLTDHLAEIIRREKIKSVGFEKENLTIAELESLTKTGSDLTGFKGLTPTNGIVEKLRVTKDTNELEYIKKAAAFTDLAFDFIKTKIKRGITEKELALELEFFLKQRADDIAFSPIVAFNENAAIPHYLPSPFSQLTNHNLILLDFGAKVGGYCSDMTRVIFFGKPKAGLAKAYQSVLAAQKLALKILKTGLVCGAIDKSIKKILTSQGYPRYEHGLGHGVGLAIHEAPRLKIGSKEKLAENMVVTVEPGIYMEGKYGIRTPKLLKELIIL
ncbi:aminopeptidase P family protein [Candidatus Gottesmanbacteria bacterium]|nr:aminopeptidase P family protein [Candidatus Gottesmanbacteria bacterium]